MKSYLGSYEGEHDKSLIRDYLGDTLSRLTFQLSFLYLELI